LDTRVRRRPSRERIGFRSYRVFISSISALNCACVIFRCSRHMRSCCSNFVASEMGNLTPSLACFSMLATISEQETCSVFPVGVLTVPPSECGVSPPWSTLQLALTRAHRRFRHHIDYHFRRIARCSFSHGSSGRNTLRAATGNKNRRRAGGIQRSVYRNVRVPLLPRASAIQELVTAWKLLWSWRRRGRPG
jgi:hypothetical protein